MSKQKTQLAVNLGPKKLKKLVVEITEVQGAYDYVVETYPVLQSVIEQLRVQAGAEADAPAAKAVQTSGAGLYRVQTAAHRPDRQKLLGTDGVWYHPDHVTRSSVQDWIVLEKLESTNDYPF